MIRSSFGLLVAVLIGCSIFCQFASPLMAQRADRIGLVQEQPSDGPFVETEYGFMVPYTETIPGTNMGASSRDGKT